MQDEQGKGGMRRREFLRLLGATGGAAMMFGAMDAWNMASASQHDAPPELSGRADGKRVIILGAGLAGMTAAYELAKLGYDTPILEARSFAGGRCQTARRGFTNTELTGETQRCMFDEGQFVNHGPWRIPYHHYSTLHYTKEFSVPLMVMINDNENGWAYYEGEGNPFSGRRTRIRELRADMYGNVDELLAKSVDQGKLDDVLSEEDKELLINYLVAHGYLNRNQGLSYLGTSARGYDQPPGAGLNPGTPSDPHAFSDLLRSGVINSFRSVLGYSQPATMFEPVGGMDQIAVGFERAVGGHIHYGSIVREIRNHDDGVTVVVEDAASGATREVEGDYCLCTIPLSVLNQIPSNFSPDFAQAVSQVAYVPTAKLGLQFARRFWEEDDGIYGGHSITNQFGSISYPSYGYQGQKGTLLAYYQSGNSAVPFSALSPTERIRFAVENGSKIHPGVYERELESGFSLAWHLTQYNLGGWASWNAESRANAYPLLNEPDGHVFLAGEHLSYLTGWMAGAIESAWLQIEKIHGHALAKGVAGATRA